MHNPDTIHTNSVFTLAVKTVLARLNVVLLTSLNATKPNSN